MTRTGEIWVTLDTEFQFRIITPGKCFDAVLYGFCNLGPAAHPGIRSRSKFASWQRAVADFTGGRANRVSLRVFRDYWYRVRVETTTHNHQKQVLPERDQYSSVTDIVEVVGKLSELRDDTKGPSR